MNQKTINFLYILAGVLFLVFLLLLFIAIVLGASWFSLNALPWLYTVSHIAFASSLLILFPLNICQLQPPKGGGLKQGTPEGGSRGYSEVAIVGTLFEVLGCDILHDHLVCDIAGRCGKISASPQMATPELLRQTPVFAQQFARCFPLDRSHNFTNGQLGRNRNKQVNMIFGDVACNDFDIHGLAYFPNEVS